MRDVVYLYLYVFGVLTIAGGIAGYVKARSGASILAGSVFGGLLLAAGYLVGHGGKLGLGLGLVISAMLAGRFSKAFRSNGKMLPGGAMALLGLVGIGLCVIAFFS